MREGLGHVDEYLVCNHLSYTCGPDHFGLLFRCTVEVSAVCELRKINGCPTGNHFQISDCLSQPVVVSYYKGELWLQINGCPPNNSIIICGCPVAFSFVKSTNQQPLGGLIRQPLFRMLSGCVSLCKQDCGGVHTYPWLFIMYLKSNPFPLVL